MVVEAIIDDLAPVQQQQENSASPFAIVNGEPVVDVPEDLYIPPDALEILLETFEGPLDLLLYLIKRKNLDILNILQTSQCTEAPAFGEVSAASGKAAYDAIASAIEHALDGSVSGIVTAPIHKEALFAAGIRHPGHTEILADHSGAERVAMLLGNDEIRVVLVTIHCSLADAIKGADFDAQMSAIRLAHEGAAALGFENPRVAVAGLNPHAGEGGLFGREEIEIISPAIKASRAAGINVSGPWPGDTVFMKARQGQFDIVVAQYHDQGLIPVKYMGMEKGVNITLGLPFVRTSPDHGTAFDIAGKGIADPTSLETAITYANRLVASKLREAA